MADYTRVFKVSFCYLGLVAGSWAQAPAGSHVFTDSATGLTWATTPGYTTIWPNAVKYCRDLRLDGHADWRLPEIEQLAAIYKESVPGPIKSTVPIEGRAGWFWSATLDPDNRSNGWFFALGGNPHGFKAHNNAMNATLCVRGGVPPPAAVSSEPIPTAPVTADPPVESISATPSDTNPIWVDTASSLMWTARDNGTELNWNNAARYCKALTLGNERTWRLATAAELTKLQQTLSDQPENTVRADGCCVWSSVAGVANTMIAIDIHSGNPMPVMPAMALPRALCVTRADAAHLHPQATQAKAEPPAPREKNYRDQGEYELLRRVAGYQDPADIIGFLNEWQDRYPQTDYVAYRVFAFAKCLSLMAVTVKAAPQKYDAIQRIVDPTMVTNIGRQAIGVAPPWKAPAPDQVERAAKAILADTSLAFDITQKPDSTTPAQWAQAKRGELAEAHKALGWICMLRHDSAGAKAEYRLSLQSDPSQPELAALVAALP